MRHHWSLKIPRSDTNHDQDNGSSTRGRQWPRRMLGVATALLALGAAGTSAAQTLQIGTGVPVVVPFEYSPTVGTGVTPNLRANLTNHIGLSLTSGVIFYHDGNDEADFEVPVMLGGRYTFRDPSATIRPYTTFQTGYSYASDSTGNSHLVCLLGSVGLQINTTRDLSIDIETAVRLPNLRNFSDVAPQLMMTVGVVYGML
jgi:hypothetical protein